MASNIIMPYLKQAELVRTIGGASETITSRIDGLKLPFEDELEKYVKVNEGDFNTWLNMIKNLLTSLNSLNVTYATLLLTPSDYNDAYASSVLTSLSSTILTNLSDGGSGLPSTTETAIYDRARNRIIFDASRAARRITYEIAKRLPYAGMIADKLQEADQDVIWALADANNTITIKQAELAYQNQRDKIKEAIENERMNIDAHERRRSRALQAYSEYDRNQVLNHWKYFDFLMNRALDFAKAAVGLLELVAKGTDQITFENWLQMSKLMAEGELRISALVSNLLPSAQDL